MEWSKAIQRRHYDARNASAGQDPGQDLESRKEKLTTQ